MMNQSSRKLYFARGCIFSLLVICLLSLGGCVSEKKDEKVTQADVLELMNKIEAAAKNKDVDTVVEYMSPGVQVRTTITASGKTETLTFDRDHYRDAIKQSLALGTDYTYSRQNTQVKIAPDGKSAVVTDETTESITVRGQVVRSVTQEAATIARENGKLVVQYLEAMVKQL